MTFAEQARAGAGAEQASVNADADPDHGHSVGAVSAQTLKGEPHVNKYCYINVMLGRMQSYINAC